MREQPPALSSRRRQAALASSFVETANQQHEIAATPHDWPVGVEWPVDGVWEECSILREDDLTCDVEIQCDGAICMNVNKMYMRRKEVSKGGGGERR